MNVYPTNFIRIDEITKKTEQLHADAYIYTNNSFLAYKLKEFGKILHVDQPIISGKKFTYVWEINREEFKKRLPSGKDVKRKDVEELLDRIFGKGGYSVEWIEPS